MKKTVFLTGASGNMGFAGFKELYKRRDQYHIVVLNRDSKKNRTKFAKYMNDPHVTIHWGDLTNADDVRAYTLTERIMFCMWADLFPWRRTITPRRQLKLTSAQ